jgi:DUF4097 and DUF4098 domain-containing protein YvlB
MLKNTQNWNSKYVPKKTAEKFTISTGSGAPSSTPVKVGDMFIDTSNGNIYIVKGNSSSADWD